MIVRHAMLLVASLSVWIAASSAFAADLLVDQSTPFNRSKVYLVGRIEQGDAAQLEEILRTYGPSISTLAVRSAGGNVLEAMHIGQLVRALGLGVEAPLTVPVRRPPEPPYCFPDEPAEAKANCTCASACFLIYAAGISRQGHYLLVHRPWFDTSDFAALPGGEAAALYDQVLADMREYLLSMGVAEELTTAILRVPSDELEQLPHDQVEIELKGFLPSFDEWITANCGSFVRAEYDRMLWLNVSETNGWPHNAAERITLQNRYWDHVACQNVQWRTIREAAFAARFGMPGGLDFSDRARPVER